MISKHNGPMQGRSRNRWMLPLAQQRKMCQLCNTGCYAEAALRVLVREERVRVVNDAPPGSFSSEGNGFQSRCSCCHRRWPFFCFNSFRLSVCRTCCGGAGKVLVGAPSDWLLQEPCSQSRGAWGSEKNNSSSREPCFSSPIVQQHSWSWTQGEATHLPAPPCSQQAVSPQHTSANPSKLNWISQCCVSWASNPFLLSRAERKLGVNTWLYWAKCCRMAALRRSELLSVCFSISWWFLTLL